MGKALEGLTEKQKVFVLEYAADLDRVRAVKEAGYTGHPNVTAAKLLANPKIAAALAEIGTKLDSAMLTVENLATQLARFVFRDVAAFVNEEGYLTCSLHQLPEEIRQCIEGWDVEREYNEGELVGERIKVRLVPKIKAIELAMKWRNMLQPNQVSVQNTVNFDWSKFYDLPPSVVDQRLQKALEEGSNGQEAEEDA